MGHHLTGLVATSEVLSSFAREHGLRTPTPLEQGLALLPLCDDDLDAIASGPHTDGTCGFVHLSGQLAEVLRRASSAGTIVYFETDYAGGAGRQAAVAYGHGSVAVPPSVGTRGPINGALRAVGARVLEPASDEFEAVGLHRHRRRDVEDE